MEVNYWALGLAFGLPLILTPYIGKLAARLGAVDRPAARKVHKNAVPRWGGLAIFAGFVASLLFFFWQSGLFSETWLQAGAGSGAFPVNEVLGLLGGGLVILTVGVIDDWRGLSPWLKLFGQLSAAAVLVACGVTVDFITNPLGGMINLGVFSIPVTIAWVVGITNALNLVDGLDGLAAGIAAIASGTVAVVAYGQGATAVAFCALLLVAAILGFLPYNFHPARIFMGDTGSLFLGFTLSSLAILGLTKSATAFALVLPILVLGVPIFDTVFAIIRRIARRQHIFEADRDHLHHRLLDLGLSHRQTVLVNYGVSLVLGGSAVLLTRLTTAQGLVVLLLLCTVGLFAASRFGLLVISRPSRAGGASKSAASRIK
ncbi:MAG: Undecaprenyl-phosphate N-acetylglucosaminyl 1-phosphate transferase TagO [Thermoanaerobacterales bacterium 50_218]|nr:MAG: Undecaprenyl-phosphate N-acetylglucosaminyl 1-phosphate transferase TagO [Thermoanaerobacterales bacterium 50_218]HAA89292.1 undecaprenyl-phosphate alpha-N-acetylglucosaminyl 1-phosphate transferase [Peptococcaceae bacterium]